jgi:tetratricopeptide (TPR) repeat protein
MIKTLAEISAMLKDTASAIQNYSDYLEKAPDDFPARVCLGRLYFFCGQFENAADVLVKATSIRPDDFLTLSMLAVSYKKTGKIEDAVQTAKKAHDINPGNSDILNLLADCCRIAGNTTGLIEILTETCVIRPGDFESRRELGDLLVAAGHASRAATVLEDACRMRPKDSAIRITLARLYESLKNNAARYTHLRDAAALNDNNIDAVFELGRFFVETGSKKKAEKQFVAALEINANHAPSLFQYSLLLTEMDKKEIPFEMISRAVKVEWSDARYHTLLSRLAWDLGKKDVAANAVETALRIDSASSEAMGLAGIIFRQTGRPDKARTVCTRAISIDTACFSCYQTLGKLSFEESDYSRAAGYFKRALETAGWDESTALLLGRAFKQGCQDEKARTEFVHILAVNPDQYEAMYHLVNLYIRSGRIEEARLLAAKAGRDEKTVWHHLACAELFEIDGNADAARISYSVALRLMPDLPEAHSGLGRIDLRNDDFPGAIVNFGKALARDPYNPYLMLDMARAYEGTGENASAFEIYQEVSDKYPQVVEAYYRFARLTRIQKEYGRSIEILKQGLKHNPESSRLLMGLGHALNMAGRFEEAISAYSQAVKSDEQHCLDAYLYMAGICSRRLANEESAQKYYRKYFKAGGKKDKISGETALLDEDRQGADDH